MRKMFAAMMALGLVAGAGAAPAVAQNNFAAPQVRNGVSANEIVTLFAGVGMAGQIVGASDGDQLVELTSPEGFVMYVALSRCASQASSSPCVQVQPYSIFEGHGLSFSHVNDFNFRRSNIATLMMMPDGRALLGLKLLLDGGFTMSNFGINMGTYMYDVAKLLEGAPGDAATNVAYQPQPAFGPAPGVIPAPAAQPNGFDVDMAGAMRAAAALGGDRNPVARD